jgi:hypothetical protein
LQPRLITSCVETTTLMKTYRLYVKDATLVRVLWKGTLLRLDSRRSGVGLQRDIQAYELSKRPWRSLRAPGGSDEARSST